jgi:hypothetical protein
MGFGRRRGRRMIAYGRDREGEESIEDMKTRWSAREMPEVQVELCIVGNEN